MKKFTLASFVLALTLFLVPTGCDLLNPGLGSKVDLSAPQVAFTGPAAGSYNRYATETPESVSGTITFTGTAADDIAVTSLVLSWASSDASVTGSKAASLSNGEWTTDITRGAAATDQNLPDGTYTFTIAATDDAGKTSRAEIILYIDNTPPTILATSPLAYGGAYQPIFYRTIDLKGEVYDASPLTTVSVAILDAAGTVLTQAVADGTNTWSARLDYDTLSSVLSDNTVYYYDISATDSAGNTSTWYYHRFDIYPLLTPDTEGYVTFPSMNGLGRLEQNNNTSASSGLTQADLDGIRLGDEAAETTTFPDLLFKTEDSGKVQWLNLPSDDAVLGLGVPVVGTILPASDGSSIVLDSVEFTVYRKVSGSSDLVAIPQTNFTLSQVGASLNFDMTLEEDGTQLVSGNYIIEIEFNTNSGASGSAQRQFGISSGVPILRETLVGGESNRMMVQAIIHQPTTMGGTSRTSDNSAKADLTYNLNEQGDIAVDVAADGAWTLLVPAASDHSNDGTHSYVLTASSGGISTSISRVFVVDTKEPLLSIISPSAGLAVSGDGENLIVNGTADDNFEVAGELTGSGVSKVYYLISDVSENHSTDDYTQAPWAVATGTISWQAAVPLSSLVEGEKTLWTVATDGAGNVSRSSISFYYDLANPTLEENAVATTDTIYTAEDVVFSGLAEDSNELVSLTVAVNGAAAQPLTVASDDTWSWTFSITGRTDGLYNLVFTARDSAGKNTVLNRTVYLDTQNPTLTVQEVDGYQSGNIAVSGTASDTNLMLVQYQLGSNTGSWSTASGTNVWTAGVNLSAAPEGDITLYVRAVDRAGNITNETTAIQIDLANPRATLNVSAMATVSGVLATDSSFTLSGTADDAEINAGRPASSSVLTWSKDGGSSTAIPLSPAANGDWTWTAPASFFTGGVADGLYTFTLTVTDVAGKTRSVSNNIRIDRTGPDLVVSEPIADSSVEGSTINIRGTSRDIGGTGVALAQYSFASATGPWTDLTMTGSNWAALGLDIGSTQGVRTLYVRSEDTIGNESTTSVVFYYDEADPELVETTVDTVDSQYRNAALSFGGTASDTNELASLSVKVGSAVAVPITVASDDTWAWTFETDGRDEGSYTIVFTATDIANKTTSVSRTVVVDRTNPAVSIVPVVGYKSGTITVSGTVIETFIGSVQYRLGSGSWQPVTGTSSWTASITLVEEGDLSFEVQATDRAGNVDSEISTIQVDLSPPSLSETAIDTTELQYETDNLEFSGLADDSNELTSLTVSVNGGEAQPITFNPDDTWSWTFPVATSADNSYTLIFTATDVANKTATVTRNVRVDNTLPVVGITAMPGYYSGIVEIGGSLNETYPAAVEYQLNSTSGTWLTASREATTWSANLNLGAATEGSHTLYVRARDLAGNISNPVSSTSFLVDKSAPQATIEEGIAPYVPVNSIQSTNARFTFNGTMDDAGSTTGRLASSADLEWTKNGFSDGSITLDPASSTTWSWDSDTYSLTDGAHDGLYEFTLTVRDAASKATIARKVVRVDTTAPNLVIEAPLSGGYVGDSAITLSGTSTDTGGVGFPDTDAVEYSFDNIEWDPITLSGSTWTTAETLTGSQGPRTIYFRSTDAVGNEATQTVSFSYDEAPPTFTEETINSVATQYTNGTVVFGGDVYDSNPANPVAVTVKIGAAAATGTGISITGDTHTLGDTWEYTFNAADHADGAYVVVFTATDAANRSVSVTRNVTVDKAAPAIPVINAFDSTWATSQLVVSGNTSDTGGTGVASVKWFVGPAAQDPAAIAVEDWNPANGTDSWFYTIDVGAASGLAEGPSRLFIRAIDFAGNVSLSSDNAGATNSGAFTIDRNNPEIQNPLVDAAAFTSGILYRNSPYTLRFDVYDSYLLDRYTITRNTTEIAAVTLSTAAGATEARTLLQTPGTGVGELADGTYEYVITLYDDSGKSISKTQTVMVDTESPELVVSSPASGEGVASNSYQIRGSVGDDSGKGVTELGYSLVAGTAPWTTITPSLNWQSEALNFSTGGEGSRTIWVRATDGLNPEVIQQIDFYYDTADPTLVENRVNSADPQYISGPITFGGQNGGNIYDSNSAAAVTLTVTVGSEDPVPATIVGNTNTANNATWSWTFDPSGEDEGTYNIVFTATDAASKQTTVNRTVVVDRTPTEISADPFSDLGAGWRSSARYDISVAAASVTDAISGVDRVEYRTSGTGTFGGIDDGWIILTYNAASSAYKGTAVFEEGSSNKIQIRMVDKAGNASTATTFEKTVQIDTFDPVIDEIVRIVSGSPVEGTPVVNGSGDLIIRVDASDDGSGEATASYSTSNSPFSATGTVSFGGGYATLTVPAATILGLGTANQSVNARLYIRVSDAASRNSAVSAFNVVIDRLAPSGSVTSHIANATVNKKLTLSGTATDGNGLSESTGQIVVWDTSLNSGAGDWESVPFAGDFQLGTGSTNNNWIVDNFNTESFAAAKYDSDTGTAGHQLLVAWAVQDIAGNTGYISRVLTVDQDSDIPEIKLNNLNTAAPEPRYLTGSNVLYGVISDDDGFISSLEISVNNGSSWAAAVVEGQSFSYTITNGDGPKNMRFRVLDAEGTTFETANGSYDSPKLYIDASTWDTSTFAFSLDTSNPEIDASNVKTSIVASPGASDWSAYSSSSAFGGTVSGQFHVLVDIIDVNAVSAIDFVVTDSASATSATVAGTLVASLGSNRYQYQTAARLNVASLASGPASLKINVTDGAGLNSSLTRDIIIDNQAPSDLMVMEPQVSPQVNGAQTFKIYADDADSSIAGVTVFVGSDYERAATKVANWEVSFTAQEMNEIFTSATAPTTAYATKDATGGLWTCPFTIVATDAAGNTTSMVHNQRVDPSGDIPTVEINYPLGGTANPVGGQVRVTGTAGDDDAIYRVFMMVDADDDGYENDAAWYNGGQGVQVNGQSSWYYVINSDNSLDPVSGQRKVNLRVRSQDTKNGSSGDIYSEWQEIELYFDNDVPQFTDLKLTKGAIVGGVLVPDGTPEVVNNYGVYANITGNWYLTGTVSDNGSISDFLVTNGLSGSLAANPEWFHSNGDGSYELQIPIGTSAGEAGTVAFDITAYDNAEPERSSKQSILINYDDTTPVGTFAGTTPIVQEDGWYKVKGTAYDINATTHVNGSDIEKVAVYFVRRDTVVDTTNYDRFINPKTGGVLQIDGTHSFEAYNGTVDYPVGEDDEYLILVDHKDIVEVHGTPIINDDGDGYVEYLKKTVGQTWTWEVDINSSNIPDGPIELHYVVFDQAGNATHYVENTHVTNNAPLITSVTVGTDLDENGSIASNEQVEYLPADYAATGFIIKNGFTTFDLDVSGGNGDLTWVLTLDDGASHSFTKTGTLRSGGAGSINTINLSAADFSGASIADVAANGATVSILVYDSAEETTYDDGDGNLNNDSFSTDLTLNMNIDLVDGVAAVTVVDAFYWNDTDDNSLYTNDTALGHIELEADLPATPFDEASGLYDRDPKVSGQISIRGSAFDDQRLTELYLFFGNGTAESFGFTGAGTTKVVNGRTYYSVASFSGGSWSNTDQWTDNGWKFVTTADYHDQSGHRVTWQLDIDTSRITTVAATDRMLRVLAMDRNTAQNSSETANLTGVVSTNNKPSYQMDVVPYIKSITRTGNTTYRSRYGRYPVLGAEANVVMTGFNLFYTGATVELLNTTQQTTDLSTGGTTGTAITASGTDTDTRTLTAPDRSGYVKVFVSGVGSLNNVNGNDAVGNFVGTSKINWYNREYIDGNTTSTDWSDDRYLSVWSNNQYVKGTEKEEYAQFPMMVVDRAGVIHASWVLYGSPVVKYISGALTGTPVVLFNCYDQPQLNDIGIDLKATGSDSNERISVAYAPDHLGVGGSWDYTGMSDFARAGGIAVSSIVNNAYTSVNPAFNADGRASYFYPIASYSMKRNLSLFVAPRTTRYGNNIHTLFYDKDTQGLKYSYVDAGNPAAYGGGNGISGWIVLDGGYNGQDRTHSNTNVSAQNKLNSGITSISWSGTDDGSYVRNEYAGANTYISHVQFNDDYMAGIATRTGSKPTTDMSGTLTANATSLTLTTGPVNQYWLQKLYNAQAGSEKVSFTFLANRGLKDEVGIAAKAYVRDVTNITGITFNGTTYAAAAGVTFTWAEGLPEACHTYTLHTGAYAVAQKDTSQSNSAGSHSSIDVTSTGYPVVMYYDAMNDSLRLAAANSATPSTAANWSRSSVHAEVEGGQYVSMKLDSNDDIHAIYYSSSGSLMYIFGDKNGAIWDFDPPVIVDSNGACTHGSLSVSGTTPQITYINKADTTTGIKWATQSDIEVGGVKQWDYVIVPTRSGANATAERLSISTNTGWTDTATTNVEAVIGYKSERYELVYLMKE